MRVYIEVGKRAFQQQLVYRTANLAGLATNSFWGTGTHLRRDTVMPQWFQASKAAAASDGHAVHC